MAATAKTEKATVAYGRSVHVGEGKAAVAGEQVVLPVEEVARLRALGFLIDPEAQAVPRGFGPNYAATSGATFKRG